MGEALTPEALGAIRARRDGAVRLAMRERLAERAQRGSWSATAAVALGIMDEDAADIAALLAEVERLRAERDELQRFVRWVADPDCPLPIDVAKGEHWGESIKRHAQRFWRRHD